MTPVIHERSAVVVWYAKGVMRYIRTLVIGWALLLLSLPVAGIVAAPVHADPGSPQLAGVGRIVDDLWQFVDDNAAMPDDQFYARFAEKAATASQRIQEISASIDLTAVNASTAAALRNLQGDIDAIAEQIQTCRQAALNKDAYAFQSATDSLGSLVDTYNNDVDIYNGAQFGHRTLNAIVGYSSVPAVIFAAMCGVLAWAVLGNAKEQDVARELLRRLRWYVSYATIALFAATLVPWAIFFISATGTPPVYSWIPAIVALGAVVFMLGQYIKARMLLRRLART